MLQPAYHLPHQDCIRNALRAVPCRFEVAAFSEKNQATP
jgi:hypothetical protein